MADNDGGKCPTEGCVHAVVVILCGLPGAGKTTLARQLQAWLEEEGGKQGQGRGVCVYVCVWALHAFQSMKSRD